MSAQDPVYYLNIGELIVSPHRAVISTVLGSCVSVCLFSQKHHIGGIIHYAHALRQMPDGAKEDLRYGDQAIQALFHEVCQMADGRPEDLSAKIAGGASDLGSGVKSYNIGHENIQIARKMLAELHIPILGESVGGSLGRKILFHSDGGRLQVALIKPTQNLKSEEEDSPKRGLATEPRKTREPRKVLIVDDSKTIQNLLGKIIGEDQGLRVVGVASNAEEAEVCIQKERPDVITLDIHMPGMTGVQWLEKRISTLLIPVVMISSLQFQEGNEVFRALELGAIDYIKKPVLSELSVVGPQIREKVKDASFAKVIQRKQSGVRRTVSHEMDPGKVLAIGASTGGTEALKEVLLNLPENIPPTVVVQHIPPVFSKAFADRLNETCPFKVKEAEDGDELRSSLVLIAPGGRQMKLERKQSGQLIVRILDDEPMNRHKPSVDYLFHSVAALAGRQAVGVILTGMGGDGAKGLLAMKSKGAKTIAQDEESSVVYGMPRVAFEIGAVEKVAPLSEISKHIIQFLKKKKAA